MAETPRERRAPLALKVRFKSATVDEFIEQNAGDISRGGIFIKSKKPLAVGTLLKFEFQLQDASRLIHGVGRVVWRREAESDGDPNAGMGIKFIKMDSKSRALVETVLEAQPDRVGAFEAGQTPEEEPEKTPFFPETTPQSELPKPEDSTQLRHAREFLASALSYGEQDANTAPSPMGESVASQSAAPVASAQPGLNAEAAPAGASADASIRAAAGDTNPSPPPSGLSGPAAPFPSALPLSSLPPRVAGLFGDQAAPTDRPLATEPAPPAPVIHADSGAFGMPSPNVVDSNLPTGRPDKGGSAEAARLAAEAAIASMGDTMRAREQQQSVGIQESTGPTSSGPEDFETAATGRPPAADPLSPTDPPTTDIAGVGALGEAEHPSDRVTADALEIAIERGEALADPFLQSSAPPPAHTGDSPQSPSEGLSGPSAQPSQSASDRAASGAATANPVGHLAQPRAPRLSGGPYAGVAAQPATAERSFLLPIAITLLMLAGTAAAWWFLNKPSSTTPTRRSAGNTDGHRG